MRIQLNAVLFNKLLVAGYIPYNFLMPGQNLYWVRNYDAGLVDTL